MAMPRGSRALALEPMPLDPAGGDGVEESGKDRSPVSVPGGKGRFEVITPPEAGASPPLRSGDGERAHFVARNRVEEPGEWLPPVSRSRRSALPAAVREVSDNWLPILLALVAVGVLVLATSLLLYEHHQRAVQAPPQLEETGR